MNFIDHLLVLLGGRKVLSTAAKYQADVEHEITTLSTQNESYEDQIADLEDRIAELEQQVSDLEDQVFDLESDNQSLEMELDETRSSLEELEDAVIARGMDPDDLRLDIFPDDED